MSFTINSLYELYKKDVYYYLISLTHNQSVAEDLTAEVFISAIKSLPNFKGTSDIKTWLFSIARHKWCEYLRKENRDKTILGRLELYISDKDFSLERQIINKSLLNRIYELLKSEPEKPKTILLMRVDGYSFYEIAKKVGVSENSARVIDFRLRKKLKEIMIKEGYSYE